MHVVRGMVVLHELIKRHAYVRSHADDGMVSFSMRCSVTLRCSIYVGSWACVTRDATECSAHAPGPRCTAPAPRVCCLARCAAA